MNKQELRAHYRTLRRTLSPSRRQAARAHLLQTIQSLSFERLASFCNTLDEIDTQELNTFFAAAGRLLLPKCQGTILQYYNVSDLNTLQSSSYLILEPNPDLCTLAIPTNRDLLLVPGLVFDAEHFRLGYGKGHFDRFLAANPSVPTAGIGFHEQLNPSLLPRDPWDLPVLKLLLF